MREHKTAREDRSLSSDQARAIGIMYLALYRDLLGYSISEVRQNQPIDCSTFEDFIQDADMNPRCCTTT